MELTDTQFKETIYDYSASQTKSIRPVVVDFVTDWCASCRGFTPTLEKVAQKFTGKVDFIKVNVTRADELVTALGIQSVPTIMFYQPGLTSPVKTLTGAMNAEALESAVCSSFAI